MVTVTYRKEQSIMGSELTLYFPDIMRCYSVRGHTHAPESPAHRTKADRRLD